MKIKSIKLDIFRRFTNLTLQDIPITAKLVVLAGPNGCGKSSLFDAINIWFRGRSNRGYFTQEYHKKQGHEIEERRWDQSVSIDLHPPLPVDHRPYKKGCYIRTAYRNDAAFLVRSFERTGNAVDETRINHLIDNDQAVSHNFKRLISQSMHDVFVNENEDTTIGAFRDKVIGDIKNAMQRLFGNLVLNSLGNPLHDGTFRFNKGGSEGFEYRNLSGGEKAAFDLLLDIIVKKREFDDTVFCIDEPEAHMNTKLQGKLLEELYNLIPDNSQLWIATHSIGMMRKARELYEDDQSKVAFIDMDGKDYDQPQVLTPVKPDRAFWHRTLDVALDDLSELVAPKHVVLCEGRPQTDTNQSRNVAIDAQCFDIIFANEHPDTKFISVGNSHAVANDKLALMNALQNLVAGTKVTRLIDRDGCTDSEIEDHAANGVKVLSRRHIEAYLFEDEVLEALCDAAEKPEKKEPLIADKKAAIEQRVREGKSRDDIKAVSGMIFNAAKQMLELENPGSHTKAFMRDILAPLLKPEMNVYQQLKTDIFGNGIATQER